MTSRWPGSRGRAPRATRPAGPARSAARPRSGRRSSKGGPVPRARPPGPATALGEVPDRLLVDLAQAHTAALVEWRRPHLVEQRLDHGADAQHLGRLVHRLGRRGSRSPPPPGGRCRGPRRARWGPGRRGPGGCPPLMSFVASRMVPSVALLSSAAVVPQRPMLPPAGRRSEGPPGEQRDQHLRGRQRAVASTQPQLAGVGRVQERDGLVTGPGRRRRAGRRPLPRASRRASSRR